MARLRKYDGKRQSVVRHRDIVTKSFSLTSKSDAMKWSNEQERQLENGNFDTLEQQASPYVTYCPVMLARLLRANVMQNLN